MCMYVHTECQRVEVCESADTTGPGGVRWSPMVMTTATSIVPTKKEIDFRGRALSIVFNNSMVSDPEYVHLPSPYLSTT